MKSCQSFEPHIPFCVLLRVIDVSLHLFGLLHKLGSFLAVELPLIISLRFQRIRLCLIVYRRSGQHPGASSAPLWLARFQRRELPRSVVLPNGVFAGYGPEFEGRAIHHTRCCTVDRATHGLPTEVHGLVRGEQDLSLWWGVQVLLGLVE